MRSDRHLALVPEPLGLLGFRVSDCPSTTIVTNVALFGIDSFFIWIDVHV